MGVEFHVQRLDLRFGLLSFVSWEIAEFQRGIVEFERGIVEFGIVEFQRGIVEFQRGIVEFQQGIVEFQRGIVEFKQDIDTKWVFIISWKTLSRYEIWI